MAKEPNSGVNNHSSDENENPANTGDISVNEDDDNSAQSPSFEEDFTNQDEQQPSTSQGTAITFALLFLSFI